MEERVYFAACALGLEPVLAAEIEALGARATRIQRGGVAFPGPMALGYRACLWLRSAIRVQELLAEADVDHPRHIYEVVSALDWEPWITPEHTLAVHAAIKDTPGLRHSGHAALVVKDAIVDQQRARGGARSSVDTRQPDVPLRLVVRQGALLLYRDLGGASLHKRGWREVQHKSPLNESIAAGLLLHAGWTPDQALLDPMCGSGTILVEAAHMAMDRAPGLERGFAFETWPDLELETWRDMREDAQSRLRDGVDVQLEGADRHRGAIQLARRSLEEAGVEHLVRLSAAPVADLVPRTQPDLVVVNPPYGERIGEGDDLEQSWLDLGAFLKARCQGATAWVLAGTPELTRLLRLRTDKRIAVHNGPIPCRFLRYPVHAKSD